MPDESNLLHWPRFPVAQAVVDDPSHRAISFCGNPALFSPKASLFRSELALLLTQLALQRAKFALLGSHFPLQCA